MIPVGSVTLSLLALFGAAEGVQTVPLLATPELSVRLRVRREATAAEVGWLVLEFENRGQAPLTVDHAHFRIESERDDPRTGQRVSSGSLASGQTYDLFRAGRNLPPGAPVLLHPGQTHRVADHPSDYSTALLGLPPRDGYCVRARAYLQLTLAGRNMLQTAEEGVPFRFTWRYPDEAGFAALRVRLRQLLQSPRDEAHHGYLLHTYLGIPEATKELTRDELLAAVEKRRHPFAGRNYVVGHLARQHPRDPVVTAWYRQRLEEKDAEAVTDLGAPGLWDPSLVEPLVRLYTTNAARYGDALPILHRERATWRDDARIAPRLAEAVRKRHPLLQRKVNELPPGALADWGRGAQALALTGDPGAAAVLRPALDDRRTAQDPRVNAVPLEINHMPVRVCDFALDALLTLLDGSLEAAYRKAKADQLPLRRREDSVKSLATLRDGMIDELKRRLAERDGK